MRKTVLAWADTRNGQAQHDSVSHALAVIERLGYESGAYDTYIRTDSHIISKTPQKTTGEPASGGPNLNNVDAIFFMGHREVPLDEKQKADLLSFVRDDGKGFVAAHVGLTALESWPEFGELLGAPLRRASNRRTRRGDQRGSELPGDEHLPGGSTSTTSSTSRRNIHATRSMCCCGSTCRTSRRIRACTVPTRTIRWRGRRCTARAASSTGRSRHASSTWDIRDVQQMYLEAIKWSLGMTKADLKPHPMSVPAETAR